MIGGGAVIRASLSQPRAQSPTELHAHNAARCMYPRKHIERSSLPSMKALVHAATATTISYHNPQPRERKEKEKERTSLPSMRAWEHAATTMPAAAFLKILLRSTEGASSEGDGGEGSGEGAREHPCVEKKGAGACAYLITLS